jgi:hypothetical protein
MYIIWVFARLVYANIRRRDVYFTMRLPVRRLTEILPECAAISAKTSDEYASGEA